MITFRITVIGSSGQISREIAVLAEELGQAIALRGALLITGGRDGVMEAVSRGAKKTGGITIGILPDHFETDVNPYVDIPLFTGISFARNYINIVTADAIIAIAGAGGTLSEIGYAIALKKRTILLKGTGGVTEMIINNIALFPEAELHVAKNSEEAVRLAFGEVSS